MPAVFVLNILSIVDYVSRRVNANGIYWTIYGWIIWLPLKDIMVLKILKNAFVASKIRMSLFLHEYAILS